MSFTSTTFVFFFLPVFLALYLVVSHTYARTIVLFLGSLLFYAWGEVRFTGILLAWVALNYVFGWAIGGQQGRRRAAFLTLGVGLNVAGLAIFKYAAVTNLLVHSTGPLLVKLGLATADLKFYPPIGISFFTFKAISYLVDVHRKDVRAERDPLIFATYLTMFPQILAGPIARFADCDQEMRKRSVTLRRIRIGAEFFILGMAQKLLIANTLSTPANAAFSADAAGLSMSLAWLGALSYTLQIYFDFAGYTNMAIGLGQILGFRFPRNFNFPYAAQSITEFWQRWHITLSTWLRDYLWFPLGANRKGGVRTTLNLLFVFGICGLWHGATFNFVAWGLFHGTLLAIERAGLLSLLSRSGRAVRSAYALLTIMTGWIVFRSESLTGAARYLLTMAGWRPTFSQHALPVLYFRQADVVLALAVGIVFSFPWPAEILWRGTGSRTEQLPALLRLAWTPALLALFLVSLMALAAASHNPFLYFRF